MLAQAERLHRQFFQVGEGQAAWEAPADVFEQGSELTVWVALPGVAPEHVAVTLEGASLRVSGVRPLRVGTRSAVIRRLEIPHGRFERRIELPDRSYVIEGFEASHGCIQLRLRRGR